MTAPEEPVEPADRTDPTDHEPNGPDRAALAEQELEALRTAIATRDFVAVAQFVVTGSSTKIRQLAAQSIEDPAQLRQLIRTVRGGNDKSAYKILASKRDALLEQTRQREQRQAEISALSTALERHSYRPFDPLFEPTLEQLENRWQGVAAGVEANVLQQVQRALERARAVITGHQHLLAETAAREAATADAAAAALRARELASDAQAQAAAEQLRAQEAQAKEQQEKQDAAALAIRQLGGMIRRARGALQDGDTRQAAGLRRAIEEKFAVAPALPVHLATQLQQLDVKLDELKDWKSFSVTPKRADLMVKMELLIGSTLHPVALAQRIRKLQQEWRTLGRGASENLEDDWQRFNGAAQRAYQPCHDYFAAQALIRLENLERREALVDRLSAFEASHNWEQPDWRLVMRALGESALEWRHCAPVDPAAGRDTQTRFSAPRASLQSRLDAEFARNIRQLELLIERVKRLLLSDDSRKASDEARDLQLQWRNVGPVPRAEEARLWEEFRGHCDAVAQKRQAQMADISANLEANRVRALGVCEELEQMAALSGPELLQSAAGLASQRPAFEASGELPLAAARELRHRFERAYERCEKAIARQHLRDAERGWNDLFEAANLVRACRLASAQRAPPAEIEQARRSAEESLTNIRHAPKGVLEALKSALARAGTDATAAGAAPDALAANELVLRTLCVRAEVYSDRPTPPEDLALRREVQLRRLMTGMGQGVGADAGQFRALTLEWLGAGPVAEDTYRPLVERFKRCGHG